MIGMINNIIQDMDQILGPLEQFWLIIASYLPNVIGAAIVLLVGWLISIGLEKIAVKLVRYSKVEKLMQETGASSDMEKMGYHYDLAYAIGKIVKWFVLVITFVAVADVLSIPQIAEFIDRIALYLPNVLAAVIILVIGLMLGRFLQNAIEGALQRLEGAGLIAQAAKWSVIVVAVMAALVQLGIARSIIEILFAGMVVSLSLALGLAFGLGGKEHAAKAIDAMTRKGKEARESANPKQPTQQDRQSDRF